MIKESYYYYYYYYYYLMPPYDGGIIKLPLQQTTRATHCLTPIVLCTKADAQWEVAGRTSTVASELSAMVASLSH